MLFLCAGVRRSASTVAFQIACELAGERYRIRRWRDRPKEAVWSRTTWWTAKTHAYLPELSEVVDDGLVKIFSTIRDPRDVVVSIMQLYGYPDGEKSSVKEVLDRGWLQSDINAQYKWREKAPMDYFDLRYEDFYQTLSVVPKIMGTFMGKDISTDRAFEIADKFSYLNNRERSKEQNIIAADMLFPGHVQTGMIDMWKYFLNDEEIIMIQEEIGEDWFVDNGYELWSK